MRKFFNHQFQNLTMKQIIGLVKSEIRILGYIFMPFNLTISIIILIFSEILGIIEKLYG